MIILIKECNSCMHYKKSRGLNGFSTEYSCQKKQIFPDCDFLHFYETWPELMQKDADCLLHSGELLPGIVIDGQI